MRRQGYNKTRAELKHFVVKDLEQSFMEEGKVDELSEDFVAYIESRSNELLDSFEEYCNKRAEAKLFWLGVAQSVLGTLFSFVILALFAMALTGFQVNPFELLQSGD